MHIEKLFYFSRFRLFSLSTLILLLTVLYGSNSLESPDVPDEPTDPEGDVPPPAAPPAFPPASPPASPPSDYGSPSYVSPPYPSTFDPVAFSAIYASLSTRRSSSKIAFDRTVTDIGYGWYPRRNEFICYYPGLYFFTFAAISPATSKFKYYFVIPVLLLFFFFFHNFCILLKGFAYEKPRRNYCHLG